MTIGRWLLTPPVIKNYVLQSKSKVGPKQRQTKNKCKNKFYISFFYCWKLKKNYENFKHYKMWNDWKTFYYCLQCSKATYFNWINFYEIEQLRFIYKTQFSKCYFVFLHLRRLCLMLVKFPVQKHAKNWCDFSSSLRQKILSFFPV
jgi:hypothetical protein